MKRRAMKWLGMVALALGSACAPAAGAAWVGDDIRFDPTGSSTISGTDTNEILTVNAAGADIWNQSDECHFVHMPVSGDFDMSIHLIDLPVALEWWTKFGFMLRETLDANAANVFAMIRPGGGDPAVRYQTRASAGATTTGTSPVATGSGASVYLRIVRAGAAVTLYWAPGNAPRPTNDASTTGWTAMGSVTLTWGGGFLGVALTSHARLAMAQGTCDNLHDHTTNATLTPSTALTSSQDIGIWGHPYTQGSSTENAGVLTIQGDGRDIWARADFCYLVHQERAGDFDAVVRVVSQEATDLWAKTGLMARATLEAGSVHVSIFVSPANGVVMQWRDATSGPSGSFSFPGSPSSTPDGSAPLWLQLVRVANTIYGRWAPDAGGAPGAWSIWHGHDSPDMGTQVGVPVASHVAGTLGTVVVDHLRLSDRPPATVWFVDGDAPGPDHNGLTWDTAFQTIAQAYVAAQPGDEIWIAEWIYHESSLRPPPGTATYGGFGGYETERGQRDPSFYASVIHGGDADTVVIVRGNGSVPIVLDGIQITRGAAWDGGGVDVRNSSLVLTNVQVKRNLAQHDGGGIYARNASLRIESCLVQANQALHDGGGMRLDGAVCESTGTTWSSNRAFGNGGAVFVGSHLEGNGDRVVNNFAEDKGGGIYTDDLSMTTLDGAMILNNHAGGEGGGIAVSGEAQVMDTNVNGNSPEGIRSAQGSEVNVSRSSVSGNNGDGWKNSGYGALINSTFANNEGNGIWNCGTGTLRVDFCTFAYNHGSGMLIEEQSRLWAASTIAARDRMLDVVGVPTSQGHNLIGLCDGSVRWLDTDIVGSGEDPVEPFLGVLGFNGGPTETIPLLAGSPAINAADPASIVDEDQRGEARPRDGRSDIGAFESESQIPVNHPPVADAGLDQTLEYGSGYSTFVSLDASGSSDPDGDPITYTWSGPFVLGGGTRTGERVSVLLAAPRSTITLTVDDGRGGTDTDYVIVTLQDTTAPVLTVPPPITVEASSPGGTPSSDLSGWRYSARATDNAAVSVLVTDDMPHSLQVGTTTTVTFTAKDPCGNTATGTSTVTVVDTTAPVLSCPADLTVEQATRDGTAVEFEATATDACDTDVEAVCDPPSGSVFPPGQTQVTCTAKDDFGNTAHCSFTVTVVDTTPPSITATDDVVVPESDPRGTVVATGQPVVSDICDPSPTVTSDAPASGVFPLGTTEVTWTAMDASGNTASDTQTITVVRGSPANQLSNIRKLIGKGVEDELISSEFVESLYAKVDAAAAALARGNRNDAKAALGQLKALIQEIDAQEGKKITPDMAMQLIERIEALIANITEAEEDF